MGKIPKTVLSNENANVPPINRRVKTNSKSTSRRGDESFLFKGKGKNVNPTLDDRQKKRKILQQVACNGNNFGRSTGGVFTQEVLDFVETQQTKKACIPEYMHCGIGIDYESSLLQQLEKEFEELNVQDNCDEAQTRRTVGISNVRGMSPKDGRICFESESQIGSSASTNYLGRKPSQSQQFPPNNKIEMSVEQALCNNRKRLSAIRRNLNRTSFRSTSILSQSTPPPNTVDEKRYQLFRLDELPDLNKKNRVETTSGVPVSKKKSVELSGSRELQTESKSGESQEDIPIENDIMTQLASQLNEMALSPCLSPITSADAESDDIEELELSGGSELDTCLIPSKGKRISSSLTLGYVDIAFPEKIKIEDFRFSF